MHINSKIESNELFYHQWPIHHMLHHCLDDCRTVAVYIWVRVPVLYT